MKIQYFALVALAVSMMSACGTPPSAEEVCGSNNLFTFDSRNEPLGSGSRLKAEIGKAAAAKAATTLGDIARDAGWSDNWDRMITVYSDADVDELNKAAQIDLPKICWQGLPYRANSDGPSPGYYLFLSNGRRVQAVDWDTLTQPPLTLHRQPSLTPLSALVVDERGELAPAG
ncbi:hypothetical protein OG563_23780 [Nocardia vinacea]|uniref:Lipoprotein n=1 Tax=Nocardia vinacea TaxID=96468 RepID=A0ABZ1YJ41_9NOCA|nr:hypothetical protein [Nocardia vinacea]